MKTIGAKELRLHLDQVLDRVLGGEDIVVSHRFKGPVKLTALKTAKTIGNKDLAGLRAFETAPKTNVKFDSDRSIKELYHGSISKKYAD